MKPSVLVEALADWGCDPTPYEPDGKPWHTKTTPGGWEPVGIINHHTAIGTKLPVTERAQSAQLRDLRVGGPKLPGPKCHLSPALVPGDTGRARVWLVGWGNVNHAGKGWRPVLDAVRAATYDGTPAPADTEKTGRDGNPFFWGLEYQHPGIAGVEWPDALLDVGHRANAAICEAMGWPRQEWQHRVLEHREWTRRKSDRSWTGSVRDAVALLAEEGPMPSAEEIAKAVWTFRVPNLQPQGTMAAQTAISQVEDGMDLAVERLASIERLVTALAAPTLTQAQLADLLRPSLRADVDAGTVADQVLAALAVRTA